jgi:hypothetical protein
MVVPRVLWRHEVVDVDDHPAEVLPIILADCTLELGEGEVGELEKKVLVPAGCNEVMAGPAFISQQSNLNRVSPV